MKKLIVLIFFNIITLTSTYSQDLLSSLTTIENHIFNSIVLSASELDIEKARIQSFSSSFENDPVAIDKAFEIVELYDNTSGALFTQGTSSLNGISPRTKSGLELENVIFTIMQSVLDYSYTEANLNSHPTIFNNVKFATSNFFPGSVNPPSDPNVSYTVKINGKHVRVAGTPPNYETQDARRPTSCYLAPGSIATVTVPAELVGIGASILVGAHTWDNSGRPNIKRLDRVTKKYDINSQTITIGSPLGGGIYINVPYEHDLGIIDITLSNVVRSPYFANTVANQTTVIDWQTTQRNLDAPWTDFESEKMMIQVPTSWIYAMDDPSRMLNDWDSAMDAISDMLGRPQIRSKTVLYAQVDLQFRANAFAPGYPQANENYNPYQNYGGNHSHYLLEGPGVNRSTILATAFHELGHGEKIYKFTGETEAFVNFLAVPVYNNKFGLTLDEAFEFSSTTIVKHNIDEAAISWMIAENFRLGNPMSTQSGQFRQEFSYQPRGYAKYADIVRLFGWEAIEDFYKQLNDDYDNGIYTYSGNVNFDPTDERILRMSKGAGYDLRPLLHFWGIHPLDFGTLESDIQACGLEESKVIYDQLMRYKTIVPMDNTTFRDFGLMSYSENSILNYNSIYESNVSQSYYQGFLKKFWNTYGQVEGQAAVTEIQNIIDLYFPNGRPINDADGDGVCDSEDICPGFNDNLIGTVCEVCPEDIDQTVIGTSCDDPCYLNTIHTSCDCTPIENVALQGIASMSSTLSNFGAFNLNNDEFVSDSNNSLAHTTGATNTEWVEIDLGNEYQISTIVIKNRTSCCSERLSNAYVMVSSSPFPSHTDLVASLANAEFIYRLGNTTGISHLGIDINLIGRYVRIQKSGNNVNSNAINLKELQIFSIDSTPDIADNDNDGVCDIDDVCPGFDDSEDADNDGIPDGCDESCPQNLPDLAGRTITEGAQVMDYIKTNGLVKAGYEIRYAAGNYIALYPGFEVEIGGIFEALIEECQ